MFSGLSFTIKNSLFQYNYAYHTCCLQSGSLTIQDCFLDDDGYSPSERIRTTGIVRTDGDNQTKFKMAFFATGAVKAEIKYPTSHNLLINTYPYIRPGYFHFNKNIKFYF